VDDRKIRILDDATARRIAAGEVIDRPAAVVRELLDNAVDADATEVEVRIEGGGVTSIRVVDNGIGMPPDDLERCILPHATSKIRSLEDLERVESLGFRGEALSSIAACARLKIVSKVTEQETAFQLTVRSGKVESLQPAPGRNGTTTEVADLFYSMPARRRFIRSASGESAACRSVFVDKALPFPSISFRFYSGGTQKTYFPAGTLLERVSLAFTSIGNEKMWREDSFEFPKGTATIIYQIPSVTRPDRRYMRVFLNRRRIDEFSLIKSMEIPFADCMPGGRFPIAMLFLRLPPHLVDFNIHPAKREARIRNGDEVAHMLRRDLRETLTPYRSHPGPLPRGFEIDSQSKTLGFRDNTASYPDVSTHISAGEHSKNFSPSRNAGSVKTSSHSHTLVHTKSLDDIDWNGTINRARESRIKEPERQEVSYPQPGKDLTYLGRFSNLFIIVSRGDMLFIIDQHAAHEKILFDALRNDSGKVQDLLVPLSLHVSSEKDSLFYELQAGLKKMGIRIEKGSTGDWQITGLSTGFDGLEDSIVQFLRDSDEDLVDLEKRLFAEVACKKAIQDGEYLDDHTSLSLAREALQLPEPRCPHGRPIWFSLSRKELFTFVGRT
jgi:DNA mismatch repair protein MutL